MASAAYKHSNDNYGNHNSLFIQLAEQVSDLAVQAGCKIIPYTHRSVPHFSALQKDKKLEVLNTLQVFIDTCKTTMAAGKSLKDSSALTWYALKKLDLRFRSDMFEHIRDNNIVEVYDVNNIQMFRNFKFFDVVSYTLEDIYCRPWPDLFIRNDLNQTQDIIDAVGKFYTREVEDIIPLHASGVHKITEGDSPFTFTVDLVVNYVAPIYWPDRSPAGFVAIETGELTCSIPRGAEAEKLLQEYYLSTIKRGPEPPPEL